MIASREVSFPMKTATCLTVSAMCFVVLLCAPLQAQQSVSFATALELARKNNPDWRAAEQEIQSARGRLTTARLISPFNPAVEAQGGPRRMPGEGTSADVGIGLSMEIEMAGQRGARVTEAQRNLQRAEAGFQDFARTFRAKLARAFFQAVLTRERLALQTRIEKLNRTLVDVTNIKFKAGDVSGSPRLRLDSSPQAAIHRLTGERATTFLTFAFQLPCPRSAHRSVSVGP